MTELATTITSKTETKTSDGLRIVLTTLGSLGDLHPYIAIALELKALGHRPAIASSPYFREKIEVLGIDFFPVRPDFPAPEENPAMIAEFMDAKHGPERVIREWVMPNVRDAFADIDAASHGADLLVSHPITYGTRMVAELRGIPWASSILAPISMMSAYDIPVLPIPGLLMMSKLGSGIPGAVIAFAKHTIRHWTAPVQELRAELGLPQIADPLFEGQHSPDLVLAIYSEVLGSAQPDWPANSQITGFAFYDKHKVNQLTPELSAFLDAGPPPIVFTLGSSAVINPGSFYEESAQAAQKLGRRAVLLVGPDALKNGPTNLPEGVIAFDYAPYSELFPRAAAIVHQGGVGTTGQAMRSGRPTLIVPFAHDQPDNAERARKLGVSRTLARHRYTAKRAATQLAILLDDPRYSTRASEVGRQVQSERGAEHAARALVELANRYHRPKS